METYSIDVFIRDLAVAIPLAIYVFLLICYVTRKTYDAMIRRGVKERKAVYYNRKIIHIFVGGVVSAFIPFIFKEPFTPFLFAVLLGSFLLYKHKSRKKYYWFQVDENKYEVNFAFAWGFSILILWLYLGNPFVAMLPPMLISFGDGITGIVRNLLFGKRTKHWAGNLAMAALMIPIGYIYAGYWGVIASVVASFVERYEYNPLDDNILIVLSSSIILIIAKFFSFGL
ncbi:dolichol kinase [Fervidicoccus sp.]|uniref:dolichol kinase n=1 Tax=Fervidicoccus sp. TaxID=2060324 RepID=UPI003D130428